MAEKIVILDVLLERVENHHRRGESIVFTNGCFDILHLGHVRYLTDARAQGDVLAVGLNSDDSVPRIKGNKRPIVAQDQRAAVLAALECVDYITLFDDPDPLDLIKAIQPDVLVKGDDWAETDIIGGDFVKANGGRVVRIPVIPHISTSAIIDTILKRYR